MIQEIAPHIFSNAFRKRDPQAGDQLVYVKGNAVAMVPVEEGKAGQFLFTIDETGYYAGMGETSGEFLTLNAYRSMSDRVRKFAAVTAHSLLEWYRTNRHCGACGETMNFSDTERALVCPNCGLTCYPRINPVVIVGVIHEDRILLTRYAHRMNVPSYALVAGFAEFGETIEDTVRREVKEETGLVVENLHYYKSQPWGFSSSLLFGFFCEAVGDQKISLDDHELGLAFWATQEEAPPDTSGVALTAHMIEMFRLHGRKVLEL